MCPVGRVPSNHIIKQDVSIRLNSSTTACDDQNGVFERSFDGVLALLDPRYSGTNNEIQVEPNPFIAVLIGWPDSTTEADLFATRENGSVLRENGFPIAVEFLLETLWLFFEVAGGQIPSDPITRENNPTCAVQNVTHTDNGYAFECRHSAQDERPRMYDSSQFFMPLSACNDSSLYPLTAEVGENRTLTGEFDPERADFRWEGDFFGEFLPESLKSGDVSTGGLLLPGDDPVLQGSFTARFRGRVDEEHSFELVVERGSNVSWVEDQERLDEQTFCPEGSGVSVRGGGMFAMLAVVGMHVVAAWV